MNHNRQAIGIIDSGMGGITVLARVRELLPGEDLIYWADSANCPYGPRPKHEITELVEVGVRQLLELGVKLIIIACNTATTVAIAHLRAQYPSVPFIGLEPAIKPAVAQTRSGKIIVLATRATLGSEMFSRTCERYASQSEVFPIEGEGLVEIVEEQQEEEPQTAAHIRHLIGPALESGADTIVLACTHYPILRSAIAKVAGSSVTIIDPAQAIARHTVRLLEQEGITAADDLEGNIQFISTAGPHMAARIAERATQYINTPTTT